MAGRAWKPNPGLAIGVGVAVGVGLSVALDNWAFLALGISLAVVFGLAPGDEKPKRDADE